MYIVKAEANQVEKIVDMSVRAFETDVYVGGVKGDCPPEFDSVEWHKQMAREGHLYQAMIGKDLVGAAIVFPDETEKSVFEYSGVWVPPIRDRIPANRAMIPMRFQ